MDFCKKHGFGQATLFVYICLAPVLVAKGKMKQGFEVLEKAKQIAQENGRRYFYALTEYMFGYIFSQFATGPLPDVATIGKNVGFLFKTAPFASKKAEKHYNNAIEIFNELGAMGMLGNTYLALGLLYKAKKKFVPASDSLNKAITFFKECSADIYLSQAEEALSSLK
jgi:tetratricopeptide (TPR) repeat protein